MFGYSRVVGMLLYLSVHNRSGIAFFVNFCARYMFSPKRYHKLAFKRLARYLNNTQDRGLVLDPNSDIFKFDEYPADGFAGMYGHESHDGPECAKIHTGFIITFSDCPILWISKLQTETSLSTMESEIIYPYHFCRDLFQIIDITQSLGNTVGLPVRVPSMKLSVHKDNAGALILARTLPQTFTPRSKYNATKMIWFLRR